MSLFTNRSLGTVVSSPCGVPAENYFDAYSVFAEDLYQQLNRQIIHNGTLSFTGTETEVTHSSTHTIYLNKNRDNTQWYTCHLPAQRRRSFTVVHLPFTSTQTDN